MYWYAGKRDVERALGKGVIVTRPTVDCPQLSQEKEGNVAMAMAGVEWGQLGHRWSPRFLPAHDLAGQNLPTDVLVNRQQLAKSAKTLPHADPSHLRLAVLPVTRPF